MVKIGVIGGGYWGPKLARNFHELAGAELSWVCDLQQDRLEHLKKLYPEINITKNYKELLASDIDAVVVATPVSTHHRLGMEVLRSNKHVMIEKPLAASVLEAEELVREASSLNKIIMVGHTFEYNPAVEAMKKIVNSGGLGDIYYINATRVNLGLFQPDINVIWDLAPHDLSILRYVLGADPVDVSAHGEVYVQRRKGIHDVAYLTLRYPNNVMANVRVSWLDPHKIRRYTVVGSKKMLVYDDIADDKIKIYDKGVDVPSYSDTEEEFRLSYRYGDVEVYPIKWVEPLKMECQQFIDSIENHSTPRSSGEVGLSVVTVLEAAQKSLNNNGQRERIFSKVLLEG